MFGARSRGAALAVALAVLLTGCVGSDPKPTSTPKPTATPLYSSDAKALAAAKESYQRYVEVLNQVAAAGWMDTGALSEVETGAALRADTSAAKENASKGLRTEGTLSFVMVRIQEIGVASVSTYLCLDVSGTTILGPDGSDITSPDRTPVIPIVSRFKTEKSRLLLTRSDQWDGKSFC